MPLIMLFLCLIGFICLQFGIEDLKREPNQTACWDGVRNYQVLTYSCYSCCYSGIIFQQAHCSMTYGLKKREKKTSVAFNFMRWGIYKNNHE